MTVCKLQGVAPLNVFRFITYTSSGSNHTFYLLPWACLTLVVPQTRTLVHKQGQRKEVGWSSWPFLRSNSFYPSSSTIFFHASLKLNAKILRHSVMYHISPLVARGASSTKNGNSFSRKCLQRQSEDCPLRRHEGGSRGQLHSFLTSVLEGGERSTSRLCPFTDAERTPGSHWLGGPQRGSGRFGDQ
jgi:hypothetical protein